MLSSAKNIWLTASFSVCSSTAGELQKEVSDQGEPDPEDSSSLAGSMHRAWIKIKSAVTNRDPHAILAECERGEDSAVAEYKKAMEADLPAPIKEVVSRQSPEVKSAHDKALVAAEHGDGGRKLTSQRRRALGPQFKAVIPLRPRQAYRARRIRSIT